VVPARRLINHAKAAVLIAPNRRDKVSMAAPYAAAVTMKNTLVSALTVHYFHVANSRRSYSARIKQIHGMPTGMRFLQFLKS